MSLLEVTTLNMEIPMNRPNGSVDASEGGFEANHARFSRLSLRRDGINQTGKLRTLSALGTSSLLQAANNFYREFSDDPAITSRVAALPQMRGSGWRLGCSWAARRSACIPDRFANATRIGATCVHHTGARSQFNCKKLASIGKQAPHACEANP